MTSVKYKFAESSDINQLVELRVLMQIEVNEFQGEPFPDEYLEKVKCYFIESLKNQKYASAVALIGDQVVATAGVCFYEKPPSIVGGTGLVGYVTNVYTRKEHRGKGIGTCLMKKLNELAQELKADKLHLGATLDGLQIYKTVGYEEPRFVNLEIKFNH
jgi:GNAT superfamily N-acetyltransferase